MRTDAWIELLARGAGAAPRGVVARRVGVACGLGMLLSLAIARVLHGPLPAPMPKRAGYQRAQLLLSAPERRTLHAALDAALPAIHALPDARKVRWSVPGARPRPRSIRPGYRVSSVPNCSAMTMGEWFGSMTPPAPTRMRLVPEATWPMTTEVAALAMPTMLWCSASQNRR